MNFTSSRETDFSYSEFNLLSIRKINRTLKEKVANDLVTIKIKPVATFHSIGDIDVEQ